MLRRSGIRSRKNKGQKFPLFKFILPGALLCVLAIWLTLTIVQLLNPFQSWNPFEKKITVGEKAIEEWKYGGENTQGDLLFYNNFNVVTIPASQGRFDAAGDYILIQDHTSDTITLESHNDFVWKLGFYVAFLPLLAGVTLLAVLLNRRARRPARTYKRRAQPLLPIPIRPRSSASPFVSRKPRLTLPTYRSLKWRWQLWMWKTKFRR